MDLCIDLDLHSISAIKTEVPTVPKKYENESTKHFSNNLHEALMSKQGNAFWKCFNSKFCNKLSSCQQVKGLVDSQQVADKFCNHFQSSSSNLTKSGPAELSSQYFDILIIPIWR